MTVIEPPERVPRVVPVSIADLVLAVEALEIVDDLSPEEAAAVARLRLVAVDALEVQDRARHSHPSLGLHLLCGGAT